MWAKTIALVGAITIFAGVCAVVIALVASAAQAQPKSTPSALVRPVPVRPSFSVALENERGERLSTFAHRGTTLVMGRLGERYAIRVTNPTNERVEAVVTVDGRDVLTGRRGDYVHGRGYLIGPRDSVRIEGFRQSLEQVAVFRFSDPVESYSARMGTPENVGVIGVAFFPERRRAPEVVIEPERFRAPVPARRAAKAPAREGAAPSAQAPKATGRQYSLGTEYGEPQTSLVREVPFERANPGSPARVVVIHYDDREGLEARGIRIEPEPLWRLPATHAPQPFPESRFAPPPPPR